MPLSTAQEFAWSLATTLMTCIVIFRAGEGYGAMPTAEFDGDPTTLVAEFDPYER